MKNYNIIEIDEIIEAVNFLDSLIEEAQKEYNKNFQKRTENLQLGEVGLVFNICSLSGSYIQNGSSSYRLHLNKEQIFEALKALQYIETVSDDFFEKLGGYNLKIEIKQMIDFYRKLEIKKELEQELKNNNTNKKQGVKI